MQRKDSEHLMALHIKDNYLPWVPIGVKHVCGHGTCIDWVQDPAHLWGPTYQGVISRLVRVHCLMLIMNLQNIIQSFTMGLHYKTFFDSKITPLYRKVVSLSLPTRTTFAGKSCGYLNRAPCVTPQLRVDST